MDFDVNSKYLASCSNGKYLRFNNYIFYILLSTPDRTVRLWHMKSLNDKEHKYTRKNIELDYASHLRFSPDGT